MELMSYVSVKTEEIEEMKKEGVNVDKEVEEGETGKPCGIMYGFIENTCVQLVLFLIMGIPM